jgi:putative transposase
MRAAYANLDALVAEGALRALANRIERSHPGAAASLREGLAETLTVARLGVPLNRPGFDGDSFVWFSHAALA